MMTQRDDGLLDPAWDGDALLLIALWSGKDAELRRDCPDEAVTPMGLYTLDEAAAKTKTDAAFIARGLVCGGFVNIYLDTFYRLELNE